MGDGNNIQDKYKNKPIPIVYGEVDKSPCVLESSAEGQNIIQGAEWTQDFMKVASVDVKFLFEMVVPGSPHEVRIIDKARSVRSFSFEAGTTGPMDRLILFWSNADIIGFASQDKRFLQ